MNRMGSVLSGVSFGGGFVRAQRKGFRRLPYPSSRPSPMNAVLDVLYARTPHQEPTRPARERVRAQSQAARVLLEIARRRAGAPGPGEWTFAKAENGAPLPLGAWNWSISHDAERVAAAVFPAPVGVDLERIAKRRPALVERVLTRAERGLLPGPDDNAFIRAWTAKEALLKAAGVGLGDLSKCPIVAVSGTRMLLHYRGATHLVRQQRVGDHWLAAHVVPPGDAHSWRVRWSAVEDLSCPEP